MTKLKLGWAFAVLLLLVGCGKSPQGPTSSSNNTNNSRPDALDPNWSLNVSTYNVYGLKLISPYKAQRMPAIGQAFKARDIDVAIFQEAWTKQGRKDILNNSGYPFSEYFDVPGTFGSGLFVMSKNEIQTRDFMPFTMDGRWWKIWEGDRLTGKGVSYVRIVKDGVPVDIFDLHTLARYGKTANLPKDQYTPERLSQLFEAFDFILSHRQSQAFILGADLNSDFSTEEFAFWKELTGLDEMALPAETSCTYCPPNSFASDDGGQIDHIITSPFLEVTKLKRDFDTEKVVVDNDGKTSSLSDHFGIVAEVRGRRTFSKFDPKKTMDALSYLKWRLEDYKNWYPAFQAQDAGVSKVNIIEQINHVVDRVTFFSQALEPSPNPDSIPGNPVAKKLRSDFKNYQELF